MPGHNSIGGGPFGGILPEAARGTVSGTLNFVVQALPGAMRIGGASASHLPVPGLAAVVRIRIAGGNDSIFGRVLQDASAVLLCGGGAQTLVSFLAQAAAARQVTEQSAFFAVQLAIFQALSAYEPLMALLQGVADFVAPGIQGPVILIGESRILGFDTQGYGGTAHELFLDIYSDYAGSQDVKNIAEEVESALHAGGVSAAGLNIIVTEIFKDHGENTRVTVRLIAESIH